MAFLKPPGAPFTDSSRQDSRRSSTVSRVGSSAHEMTSNSSHSRQTRTSHFRSIVRMLAPALWARIEAKKKAQGSAKTATSTNSSNAKALESLRLEETLEIQHLEELMYRFKTHIPDAVALKKWLARRGSINPMPRDRGKGKMTLDEFHNTLADLVGIDKWDGNQQAAFDKQMQILFRKVDMASDGMVDWDEFCTYLMLQFQENDSRGKSNSGTFLQKPNIVRIAHNKETTTKVVKDFNPLRYVSISKEGIIGVWSTELELQRTIEMEGCNNNERSSNKRHVKMWITDAVTLPNVHKMAVSTTNRDIYFYDMSIPAYTAQFHLCAFGNVVLCLDYYYDKKNPAQKSMLLFGDDNGSIHFLYFSTPVKGLFETPFKKTSGSQRVFFKDLSFHSRFVSHLVLSQVHSDWVRKLRYFPSKDFIISCSSNGKDSLVVRDVDDKKRKTYVFRVAKGVDCFDYSKELNVIATGGVDHAVRLWDPYVTSKPVAIMKGHQSSIVDLVIHERLVQVFSYDKDGVLKAWEIKEQSCLQTMTIKFPFGHRYPEHGPFPFFLMGSSINSLLITSNDCLAEIKLGGLHLNKSNKTTHSRPLCGALFNPEMNQVITACEGSMICFWSLETGRKMVELTEAHGNEEISCMALDSTKSRLFTGTREGSIHVWNASNGHMLNRLEPIEEAEVTSILSFPEKHKLLSVGWHRKIVLYNDDVETFSVKPDMSWKGGQVHQDDILTADFCLPNYIATASFDGDLNLWSMDRQKILRRIKKGAGSLFKSKMKKVGLLPKTESSTKRGDGSLQAEGAKPVPVDKVLFLTSRAQWKCQESAILVSSQGGKLEFWSTYGVNRPMGSFYAASEEESTVLALATDHEDNVLITGDSKGHIALWDISNYCISKTEAAVIAQLWSKTQDMGAEDGDISPEGTPPQLITWHAHSDVVVSVEYITRNEHAYVLSASLDQTARLWTSDAQYVSMFGQQNMWDLDDPRTFKCTGVKWDEGLEQDRKSSLCPSPMLEREHKTATPSTPGTPRLEVSETFRGSETPAIIEPSQCSESTELPMSELSLPDNTKLTQEKGFLPTIATGRPSTVNGGTCNPSEPEDDPYSWQTSEYYRSMTSLVLERSKTTDSWSILGHNYNMDFKRRMKTRQSRRHHVGQVNTSLTAGGGLGSNCSPFQALHIPETREYSLPKDMPITPRMRHKGGRNSAQPFWVAVSQGSLPTLPPLRRPESMMTVGSSVQKGDSTSQLCSSENSSSQFSLIPE